MSKLPNSTTAVGVNKVNHVAGYNTFYMSSTAKTLNTELNGVTTLLTTSDFNVTAGQKYKLKLLIGQYDTAIFFCAHASAHHAHCARVHSWLGSTQPVSGQACH